MHDGLGSAVSRNAVSAVAQERRCSEAQHSLGCATLTTAEPKVPRETVPQSSILQSAILLQPCYTGRAHASSLCQHGRNRRRVKSGVDRVLLVRTTKTASLAGDVGLFGGGGGGQDGSLAAGMLKSPRPTPRRGSSRGGVQRSERLGSALGKSGCMARVFCGENLGKMEFGIQCRRQLTIWNGEGGLLTPELCHARSRMWC